MGDVWEMRVSVWEMCECVGGVCVWEVCVCVGDVWETCGRCV